MALGITQTVLAAERQAAGPAAAGLQASIRSDRTTYRVGERVVLTLTMTNVGEELIIFDSWQILMSYDITISKSGDVVPCTELLLSNAPPRDRSQSISLAPGDQWADVVDGLRDQNCRYRLEPGVYMLKATVTAGKIDDAYGYGEWEGQLSTNMIQVAIIGQPWGSDRANGYTIADIMFPDRSTPERTVRRFWWAITNGKKDVALACSDREKIANGRHGRDVEAFIAEHAQLDARTFRYLVGTTRVSIESPAHHMDYELELRPDGQWVIVSIHP